MLKKFNSIPLLLLLLMPLTACEKIWVEAPANDPEAIFENLWQTFAEEYAPFEERGVDWAKQYRYFRPQVNPSTTDDELYEVISRMLATLNDGHVTLTTPNRAVFNSNRIFREQIDDHLFDRALVKTFLEPGYKVGEKDSYFYGKLKNQRIAYIYFDYVADNFFKLNDFLNEYAQLDGLIIDLRHNQGGDFTYCFSEIGRLTNQTRYVFRSKTKNGKAANDYTSWKEWHIHPKGNHIDKPIIVLADRYTISAGERSLMAFKTLPNVTVVGDTTNGAHGTMIGRELANGWDYSLVPQKVELYDGRSYESLGIAPDIYARNSVPEMVKGIDRVLQVAIDELR
jgi:carboxyl-terminal processing protease